jgi:hypothetical protein
MLKSRHTLPLVLVLLALAAAVATAVAILLLPTPGTIRYDSSDSRSSLSQLRSSLAAVGIVQPTGTIQNLVRRDLRPLTFRAATYWTESDVSSRRNDYLAAGGMLVVTLLAAAFVLERRPGREGSQAAAETRPPTRRSTQSTT